jgi:hypothetical protein
MKYTNYDFIATDRVMIANGGSFSWRTYTDINGAFGNPGSEVFYNDGTKDKAGRPTGKPFTISQTHYKLQAKDGQKDYSGIALYAYFINAPFCEGSPNGNYTNAIDGEPISPQDTTHREANIKKIATGEWVQHNVKFRLLETELDAQVALEAGMKRTEAQMSAGQIDEETLAEIAALIGAFGKPDKLMRLKVYEFAGKRPLDYFNYLNSGDRGIRAIIRKGINDKILRKVGSIIYWEDSVLGNDENAAVSALLGDRSKLDGLQEKVKLTATKKPSGRPKSKE